MQKYPKISNTNVVDLNEFCGNFFINLSHKLAYAENTNESLYVHTAILIRNIAQSATWLLVIMFVKMPTACQLHFWACLRKKTFYVYFYRNSKVCINVPIWMPLYILTIYVRPGVSMSISNAGSEIDPSTPDFSKICRLGYQYEPEYTGRTRSDGDRTPCRKTRNWKSYRIQRSHAKFERREWYLVIQTVWHTKVSRLFWNLTAGLPIRVRIHKWRL